MAAEARSWETITEGTIDKRRFRRPYREEVVALPVEAFDNWLLSGGAQDMVVRDVNRRTATRYTRQSSFRLDAENPVIDLIL